MLCHCDMKSHIDYRNCGCSHLLHDHPINIMKHLDNPETIDTPASEAFQQIQQILYSTEVRRSAFESYILTAFQQEGFEVPEGEEEEETF